MIYTEITEITVLCMIYDDDKILLQNRIKKDWNGITFPGGHVNKNESFVKAVVREMKEETGLDIYSPQLCGVEQFLSNNNTRYLILLFKTNKFSGNVISSNEGEMLWIKREDLHKHSLVKNFNDILKVFDCNDISELFYNSSNVSFPQYY